MPTTCLMCGRTTPDGQPCPCAARKGSVAQIVAWCAIFLGLVSMPVGCIVYSLSPAPPRPPDHFPVFHFTTGQVAGAVAVGAGLLVFVVGLLASAAVAIWRRL